MRALVLAGGESWRLPGPVPKPFRLLGDHAVVAHVVDALGEADCITQIDVLVRFEHEDWATRALWGHECDILPRPTMGPAARVAWEMVQEPFVVVLGDTLVSDHADNLKRLVANEGPRARVLVDDTATLHYFDGGATVGIRRALTTGVVDVGSYYIPPGESFRQADQGTDESVLAALMERGPLDPVHLIPGSHWRDVGTPEGFAAAELAILSGRL